MCKVGRLNFKRFRIDCYSLLIFRLNESEERVTSIEGGEVRIYNLDIKEIPSLNHSAYGKGEIGD